MPTPIENLVANVNAQTQRDTLQSIGAQQSARRQVADKASAINAIVDSADQTARLNFFNGIPGDGTAESLLASDGALIDKVSERIPVIETLNNSESAIRKLLCRREGRDPANFPSLSAVAADQGLMQSIASRQESSKIAARSQKASAAISASQTAMTEIGNSATARAEAYASETALSEIRSVDQAIAKLSAGEIGADAANFPDAATLAGDATAMQGVIASQTALGEVVVSQPAMQAVAASQTAMQEVGASQTAMTEVAASQTAMTEIDKVDFAVRAIMCGTTTLDPTSFADADAISQDAAAVSEIIGDATTIDTLTASETAMQEVATSQTAMQEMANTRAAVGAIIDASNSILENTLTASATATAEFDSSNLEKGANAFWNDATFGSSNDSIPNNRVIITSNNTNGNAGTGLSFGGVGSVTDPDRVFIGNVRESNGNQASTANVNMTYVED